MTDYPLIFSQPVADRLERSIVCNLVIGDIDNVNWNHVLYPSFLS
jgi:hypothetical protein